MKRSKLILIPLLIILIAGMVSAKPHGGVKKPGGGVEGHLWLDIPGCTYIGEDPDPWLTESCVTYDTSFDLSVTNMDKNEDSYNTTLIIALNNDPSLIGVTIDGNPVTGFVYGSPSYQGYGPHGIFPTYHTEYDVGFVGMDGNSTTVAVVVSLSSAEDMVNFGGVGFDIDGNLILKTPFSHDATTYLPEFTTIGAALILIGAGAYAIRKRRK